MHTQFIYSLIMTLTLCANASITFAKGSDEIITELYHSLASNPTHTIPERLNLISKNFFNCPYENNALGEGKPSHYDEFPRYRTDAFDCETYVDTVIGLTFATNLHEFKQCIDKIRYQAGKVSFITRNHFASLDWNLNNQKQGFIRDITKEIVDKTQHTIAIEATAIIDKPKWYEKLPLSRIRIKNISEEEENGRLHRLRKEGMMSTKASEATIPYLPLTKLFNAVGEPNLFLFNQIPNGAIIEIVRPNWDLTNEIGTHLNVSHLGFAFREKNVLMFRQASSLEHQVVDTPLIDYLKKTLNSPTIRGINVQVVNAQMNKCSD